MTEIARYLEVVGTSPSAAGQAFEDLLGRLGELPEVTPADRDDKNSAYWSFPGRGVEFLWSAQVLVSATLFVQADPDQGYAAYPEPLFLDASAPTRADVERQWGPPDACGEWKGAWIRYDDARHKVRFEFDEATDLITFSITDATP